MSVGPRPVRDGGIARAREDVGCIGGFSGMAESLSASATRLSPARIEGQHGVEPNPTVLSRRRAPHRAGQHACRTSIPPRAGFVYAAPAMTGRPRRGLAVCSCARGAAARSSCAAAATGDRSTAVSIAPDRHAARPCAERADAVSKPGGGGGCMPPGWSGIGRSWPKVPPASPLECLTRAGREK